MKQPTGNRRQREEEKQGERGRGRRKEGGGRLFMIESTSP
jgi:hypothetical protein